jgi:hypothetical protein
VIPAHRERTALGRRWWVQAVYQRPIEAPCERQSLIGDHRRHADSCEEPRAATRRDDDQHCAEREERAEYDVSFQGADSTTPLDLGAPVRASSRWHQPTRPSRETRRRKGSRELTSRCGSSTSTASPPVAPVAVQVVALPDWAGSSPSHPYRPLAAEPSGVRRGGLVPPPPSLVLVFERD